MSGALVGMRIDGEKKLLRLHGARDGAEVLAELQTFLSTLDDASLRSYAQALQVIRPQTTPLPSASCREILRRFLPDPGRKDAGSRSWPEVFSAFPGLQGWHARLPYMPAADLDTCADVGWGYLLDLDAGELQIFVNRHGRFHWHNMACGEPANCTVALPHVRQMDAQDLDTLHALLRQYSYGGGIDPRLPLRDALSEPFPGPGAWVARLQLRAGRARLLLERGAVRARLRQVGELKLDDPHCGAVLRAALDARVQAMALAVYGPGASLAQVSKVADCLPHLPFDPRDGGLPLLDLALRPGCELDLTLGPSYFDDLRSAFLNAGMSVQGWRFLIRQDNEALRFVLQFFPPSAGILRDFAHFINLLASALQGEPLHVARCQPGLRGVERILDRTRGRPDPLRQENARIFLRAIMRARLTVEETASLAHDAQDVSDFVYTRASVLKGATWRSLRRRSDEWHRALLITVDPEKDVRWPALLRHYSTGPFVAIELDCGFLLAEEGLEQRHCIGTYVNACSSGASRVFSLRRNGRRTATIELQRTPNGAWRLVQIRGKANSVIQDPVILAAAEAVAQAYSKAAVAGEDDKALRLHQALQPGAYVAPAYLIHRQEHWTG